MGDALRLPDGTGRTHEPAEMAAYAAGTDKARPATVTIEDDGLMTTITARHLTTATANAQLMIELRIDDCIAIKRVGL